MIKVRYILIALMLAGASQMVLPLQSGSAAMLDPNLKRITESNPGPFTKIQTTADCINHMRGYRSAIRFLQKRLERSPSSVTVHLHSGESVTLLNRHHVRMQSQIRLLQYGMLSKETACELALAKSEQSVP